MSPQETVDDCLIFFLIAFIYLTKGRHFFDRAATFTRLGKAGPAVHPSAPRQLGHFPLCF